MERSCGYAKKILFFFSYISISFSKDVSTVCTVLGKDAQFSWSLSEPLPLSGEAFTVLDPKHRALFQISDRHSTTESNTNRTIFQNYEKSGKLSFVITNAKKSDEGTYMVRYGNKLHEGQRLTVLTSVDQPKIKELSSVEINDITLNCKTNGISERSEISNLYQFIWFLNEEQLDIYDEKYNVNGSRLYIKNVTEDEDGGNITCALSACGTNISTISEGYFIESKYGPKFIKFRPDKFHYQEKLGNVIPNITCISSCNPPCNYIWYKVNGSDSKIKSNILSLDELSKDDSGTYVCHAENSIDIMSKYVTIHLTNELRNISGSVTDEIDHGEEKLRVTIITTLAAFSFVSTIFAVVMVYVCKRRRNLIQRSYRDNILYIPYEPNSPFSGQPTGATPIYSDVKKTVTGQYTEKSVEKERKPHPCPRRSKMSQQERLQSSASSAYKRGIEDELYSDPNDIEADPPGIPLRLYDENDIQWLN